MKLGDEFPNFSADTSEGPIKFHDWMGDSWAILFSHPADFTPVCTTELARAEDHVDKFKAKNVKLIALSCNSVESHKGWIQDVCSMTEGKKSKISFPIIADENRELAVQFGMLDPEEKTAQGLPLTARCVFIIAPDKKLKLLILYPATTGRNFDEILRVVDSLQLTAHKKVATPVDWKDGDKCMVLPNISKEDAQKLFPKHKTKEMPSGKGYVRLTPQPE